MSIVTDSALRLAAIVSVVVLVGCGAGFHLAFRAAIPRLPWLLGWVYGALLLVVGVAIFLNALTSQPITTGMRLLTAVFTIGALLVGGVTLIVLRRATAFLVHLDHDTPCGHPLCEQKRTEGRSTLWLP